VSLLNCPHCGKEVPSQDAIFCPYCSKPLRITAQKRTGFPTASGVLVIIGSSMLIFLGIIALIQSSYDYYYGYSGADMVVGILSILAFAFGLTAGILTLKRKVFPLAIIGISLVLVSSIVASVSLDIAGWVFGVPVMILSILSLVFAGISKREFS
jgi:hypothetical protein